MEEELHLNPDGYSPVPTDNKTAGTAPLAPSSAHVEIKGHATAAPSKPTRTPGSLDPERTLSTALTGYMEYHDSAFPGASDTCCCCRRRSTREFCVCVCCRGCAITADLNG